VSEIVIENRQIDGSRVLPQDTEKNINMFLGYKYKEKMYQWTKKREDPHLDSVIDRWFECWKCKKLRDCTQFQSTHSGEREMFFQLLSAYVQGKLPCCTGCVLELTICHVPTRIESSRKTKKMKV